MLNLIGGITFFDPLAGDLLLSSGLPSLLGDRAPVAVFFSDMRIFLFSILLKSDWVRPLLPGKHDLAQTIKCSVYAEFFYINNFTISSEFFVATNEEIFPVSYALFRRS